MNPALECIFARRSCRQYGNQEVSEEAVRDLLEAAMAAPSAVAKDPWDFIVVRDQNMRDRIADALPNGQMLREAPLGIVVCGDLERAHGNELSFMLQDCSAAIENILLAANLLGLGACWLGVHPRPERIEHLEELFGLPDSVVPISVVAVGRPRQKAEPRTRFNPDRVHTEAW